MPRAGRLDLRYEHVMPAVPLPSMSPPPPLFETRSLVGRLRGLRALVDAERGHLAAWLAARPQTVPS